MFQQAYGVFQMLRTPPGHTSCKVGNLPAFLRHFMEDNPLLVGPTQDSESQPSSVRNDSTNKKVRLAVRVIQCKGVLFVFWSWFAKEANVANNNNG